MLNRGICVRCHKERGEMGWEADGLDSKWPLPTGDFFCPGSMGHVLNVSTSPPPRWCPYALEHIMKEAKDAG